MDRYIFLVWWLPLVLLLGFGLCYIWQSLEQRMTRHKGRPAIRTRYSDPRSDSGGSI